MKTKYDRMSKLEKKELYNKFKKDKPILVSKMNRFNIILIIGIIYSIIAFIYDFLLKKGTILIVIDIIIFIFCVICFIRFYYIKKGLLNKYAIEKHK